jgi:hypothetical protein
MSTPLLWLFPERSASRSMLMIPALPAATEAVIFVGFANR